MHDGIFKQLQELERVHDMGGQPLIIEHLDNKLYELRRYREVDGPVPIIDCFVGEKMRQTIASAMKEFYASKYGDLTVFDKTQHNCFFGPFDEYEFPSATRIGVLPVLQHNNDILWFVDIIDLTKRFDIQSPRRHLIITNFSGIHFYL